MKRKFLKVLLFPLCFIVLLIIFNILMTISCSFPSKLIEKHVRESSKIMYDQGNYNFLSLRLNASRDNYTDAIMVNYAYSIDNKNILYSYMSGRKNYDKKYTKTEIKDTPLEGITYAKYSRERYDTTAELVDFLNGDVYISSNYARYWQGYLVFLRPLLLLFNVSQIRLINCLIVLICLFIIGVLCFKKYSKLLAFVLPLGLICSGIISASLGLGTAPIFIVGLLSTILLLLFENKIKNIPLYYFIIGCISNFVDFLSVPMVAWAIPTLVYVFICFHNNPDKKLSLWYWIKIYLKTIIPFIIGYALTWISKWLIYDSLFHENIIHNAIEQVRYRSQINDNTTAQNFKEIIFWMNEDMFKHLGYSIPVLAVILFVFSRFSNITLRKNYTIIPFMLISIIPYIWYKALSNHTLVHFFFVYRHLGITITAILCALIAPFNVTLKEHTKKYSIKKLFEFLKS